MSGPVYGLQATGLGADIVRGAIAAVLLVSGAFVGSALAFSNVQMAIILGLVIGGLFADMVHRYIGGAQQ